MCGIDLGVCVCGGGGRDFNVVQHFGEILCASIRKQ
jgi:hypothetical protein